MTGYILFNGKTEAAQVRRVTPLGETHVASFLWNLKQDARFPCRPGVKLGVWRKWRTCGRIWKSPKNKTMFWPTNTDQKRAFTIPPPVKGIRFIIKPAPPKQILFFIIFLAGKGLKQHVSVLDAVKRSCWDGVIGHLMSEVQRQTDRSAGNWIGQCRLKDKPISKTLSPVSVRLSWSSGRYLRATHPVGGETGRAGG